jgi:hypothetical protein
MNRWNISDWLEVHVLERDMVGLRGSSLFDCYASAHDCRLKVCASVADTVRERFSGVSNQPTARAILQFS